MSAVAAHQRAFPPFFFLTECISSDLHPSFTHPCASGKAVMCGSFSRNFQLPAAEGTLFFFYNEALGRENSDRTIELSPPIFYLLYFWKGECTLRFIYLFISPSHICHILILWMTKTFRSFSSQIPFYVRTRFLNTLFSDDATPGEWLTVAKILTDQKIFWKRT